ncbi:MAG TPA: MarR family winged helix-turn-helix transcriptional regulator [Mycobacterium sp.]|uniref:MarR family winged helix-turn-helix transcriptional regulator n=1 Tax=Mycobacterium sp. TaxID=1785 RepID=UPI002CFED7D7|nr:MarR family winged helix-turn-helix transcriptional regulator [Mycobacterium sp.]HXO80010.1 MarR family winged helix-turn-helix transcriptional regulator [Mycobacterium sp.]
MQTSEAERSIGYLVKRVQQGLRRRCDLALKPTGLSMAQYSTLRALHEHPEASAAELARMCFVTRQSLQDVLSGLRAAGLVETANAPPRGRARSLELTRLGSQRLGAAHDAVFAVEAVMLQGISTRDRRTVAEALLRCAENVEDA